MVLILDELRMRSKAVIFLLLISHFIGAQQVTEIKSLDGEYWWGGVTALGSKMPYIQPMESFDLSSQNNNNQVVPLLVSSKGRYVWSDYPFAFSVTEQGIRIDSKYEQIKVQEAGRSLRDAIWMLAVGTLPPVVSYRILCFLRSLNTIHGSN